MIQTEYRLVSVGVSVGPAYIYINLQKHAIQGSSCMSSVKRHPSRHTKEKESIALSETDGLCSSEHGLRGINFGGVPYRLSVMQVS